VEGCSVVVSPEVDENTGNAPPASSGSLVLGKSVPPLSLDSEIPFLSNKLHGVVAYYTEEELPAILKDIGAKRVEMKRRESQS